ncbi:hypothetical protein C8J55DRAFT_562773 [Lentinula edodes]|uniref:Uncharacterized protein n=1 Tax=Lentinula lateritia TaxID=40482 RepID=A0A9W9A723_9AGAR|nr:hypothetical protein C8J55DRAFT_562773 [Lentinula edodes]
MPPTLRSQSQSVRDDQESVSTDLPDVLDLVRDIHAQRTRRRSSTPVPGPSAPATRRLSPPRTDPGIIFNGKIMPPTQYIVNGTTLGLYFGRTRALTQIVRFKSKNTSKGASPDTIHNRFVKLRSKFSDSTKADRLFEAIVVVDSRRYFVGGTYDKAWRDRNLAIASFGCNEIYKGDIGITFFAIREPERFVESLPRYKSEDGRRDIICRVLTVFAINVRNHVEHGVPYKALLRG